MTWTKLFQKAVILVVLLLFVGTSVIPSTGNMVFGGSTNASSEIYMVDETTIELTITSPTFEFGSISTERGMFATVEVSGEGFTTTVGEARLPIIKHMLEIPQGADPEIVVTSTSWESTSLNKLGLPARVAPVQPSVQKIPGATGEFVLDNQHYNNHAFTPSNIAKVADVGEIRGRRFALVEVSPLQYNPSSGEIRTMTACELIINLPGSDMTQTYEKIERYTSPAFENLFKVAFANYGYYENDLANIPRDQEGYLIIVYDNFVDEIQPLADWKTTMGYDTTVTETSDIPGGATKENIKAYIEEAYNEWTIPPVYVLLVGDTPQIPTYTGTTGPSAVDLYYVTINSEDYFPDIFIGRFPAALESHVTAMVDKTVYYEQGNFPSNEWIKKAAFLASTEYYWVSEETHNYVIDNYLDPNGYTCDKLYTYTYGATTQQVHDAINDGRSLVIFSGHGSPSGWGDGPPFYKSDVQALMNQDMYPFVCSHSCSTNTFDDPECFGEVWLREEDKGGLAFWGASASTFWDEDDILERATFQARWDDGLEWVGGMTDMGLYYLYENYSGGGDTKYYFEAYNVLGDPSVKIWSPNSPPEKPEGPTEGVIDVEYTFETSTTDLEGDNIYYQFDWGDNSTTNWLGSYASGASVQATHQWKVAGEYEIRVKAKDDNNSVETAWSEPLRIHISIIDIGCISGGLFRVSVEIKNNGELEATNVKWNMTLEGGTIFLGKESNGEISSIPAEGNATATSDLIIGFGKIRVTVIAEIPEGSDTREQSGFVLLFFIYINPSGSI
ncbi:MAG: hypothetical protein KAU84_00230 [Thermoplasmatales archaeon]|nr:hypothetical protein [Thermoplasmatales archaeon]